MDDVEIRRKTERMLRLIDQRIEKMRRRNERFESYASLLFEQAKEFVKRNDRRGAGRILMRRRGPLEQIKQNEKMILSLELLKMKYQSKIVNGPENNLDKETGESDEVGRILSEVEMTPKLSYFFDDDDDEIDTDLDIWNFEDVQKSIERDEQKRRNLVSIGREDQEDGRNERIDDMDRGMSAPEDDILDDEIKEMLDELFTSGN